MTTQAWMRTVVGLVVLSGGALLGGGCAVSVDQGGDDDQLGTSQQALCYDPEGFCDPPPGPECGDEVCDGGESASNCPQDCLGTCGDGVCNRTYYGTVESYQLCPHDCYSNNTSTHSVCGNGIKETSAQETCSNCPADWGGRCPGYKSSTGPQGGTYYTATSCTTKCQYCSVYYKKSDGSVYGTAGRCVPNSFYGYSCTYYPGDSCYNLWQCC